MSIFLTFIAHANEKKGKSLFEVENNMEYTDTQSVLLKCAK